MLKHSFMLSTFALLALYLALYIVPLGVRPLVIPDETRYAEIPREMIAAGTWLSPSLDGMKYFEKPSPGYWPTIISMKAFGENAFAVRLPQAIAAGLTAILVFLLARRFRKDSSAPLMAICIQLVIAEAFLVGTFAVLDGILTLFTTGALTMFYYAWTEKRQLLKQTFLLLAGLSAGCAFMAKGLIGLAIIGLPAVAFLLWMRDWKAFLTMALAPLAGAFAIAVPWVVAQHLQEPDFWKYFIMVEHFGRFAGEGAERHSQPFWFYLPVLLGGLMPFTIFTYSLFKGAWRLDWRTPFLRYAAAWVVLPFILLSLSSGKLGTYVLPLFPALAVLGALMLREAIEAGAKDFDIVAKAMSAIIALAIPCLLVAQFALPVKLHLYSFDELPKLLLAIAALGFMVAMLWLATKPGDANRKVTALCASPLMLMLCWHLAFPYSIAIQKAPEAFIASCARKIAPETAIAASSDIAGAVCWTLKRNDIDIFRKVGEFDYGLKNSTSPRRFFEVDDFKAYVKGKNQNKRVAILLPSRLVKRLFDDIEPLSKVDDGIYAMLIF